MRSSHNGIVEVKTMNRKSNLRILVATCLGLGLAGSAGAAVLDVIKTNGNPNGNGTLQRGQSFQYTVKIDNTTAFDIRDVRVRDALPAGVNFVSLDDAAGGMNRTVPPNVDVTAITVPAMGTVNVVFTVRENGIEPAGGMVCNTVEVTSAAAGVRQMASDACLTIAASTSTLTAAKSNSDPNGNGTLRRGQTTQYRVRLTNTGAFDVRDVRVQDVLPAGLTLASVDATGGGTNRSMGNNVDIVTITVPAGGMVDVLFTVREDGSQPLGASVCNSAEVTSAASGLRLTPSDACLTVVSSPSPVLVASKFNTDPNMNGTLNRGQTVQYGVRILNNGSVAATDVRVQDLLPPGVTFVSMDSTGGGTNQTVGNNVDVINISVAAPGLVDVVFTVREDGTQAAGSMICNQATVSSVAAATTLTPSDTCLTIATVAGCPVTPGPIAVLKAVKDLSTLPPAAVNLSWQMEANSAGGYRLYSVPEAMFLPPNAGNPNALLECATTAIGALTCTDPNAIPGATPRLFYQALGLCPNGTEGSN